MLYASRPAKGTTMKKLWFYSVKTTSTVKRPLFTAKTLLFARSATYRPQNTQHVFQKAFVLQFSNFLHVQIFQMFAIFGGKTERITNSACFSLCSRRTLGERNSRHSFSVVKGSIMMILVPKNAHALYLPAREVTSSRKDPPIIPIA